MNNLEDTQEQQIWAVERMITRLCGELYVADLPPLAQIDSEYQHMKFESLTHRMDYLLLLLEDLVDDIVDPED